MTATIIKSSTASFTRPNDTTTYAAGDVVGPTTTPANMTFTLGNLPASGGAILRWAQLVKGNLTTANASYVIWLFSSNPTPIADNSAWTFLIANISSLVATIPLDTARTGGTGSTACQVTTGTTQYTPITTTGTLYGVLVAGAAYVPTANETFDVTLGYEVLLNNR